MVAPLGEVCWPITVAQQEAINFSAYNFSAYDFNSVQFSRSVVSDSVSPGITAHQASLSITNSRSLPKLMSIESVIPSKHLFLCHPLLLPSIFPSIRVFYNESVLHIRWPKYLREFQPQHQSFQRTCRTNFL